MNTKRTQTDPPLLLLRPVATTDVTDAILSPNELWRVWSASVGLAVAELPVEGPVAISNDGTPKGAA